MIPKCKRGHKLIAENIYVAPSGKKVCRICRKIVARNYRKDKPWRVSFNNSYQRVMDKNHYSYKYYGGKGIKFLVSVDDFKELWFRDKAYLMKRPSIDRKDNRGNYTKSNCRFIELSQNCIKDKLGENNHSAKLTANKVLRIKKMFEVGVNQKTLAGIFKVSTHSIWSIVHNKTWKHI